MLATSAKVSVEMMCSSAFSHLQVDLLFINISVKIFCIFCSSSFQGNCLEEKNLKPRSKAQCGMQTLNWSVICLICILSLTSEDYYVVNHPLLQGTWCKSRLFKAERAKKTKTL